MNRFIKFLSIFLIINFIPNIYSSDSLHYNSPLIEECYSCCRDHRLNINFNWPVSFILRKYIDLIDIKNANEYYASALLQKPFRILINRTSNRILTIHNFLRTGLYSCNGILKENDVKNINQNNIQLLLNEYTNIRDKEKKLESLKKLLKLLNKIFDENISESNMNDLKHYWPDLHGRLDDRIFWHTQYLNHGICNTNISYYFQQALDFGRKLNGNHNIRDLLDQHIGRKGKVSEFKDKFETQLALMQGESEKIKVEIDCITELENLDEKNREMNPNYLKLNGGINSITICFHHDINYLTMVSCKSKSVDQKFKTCKEENNYVLSEVYINYDDNIMLNNKTLVNSKELVRIEPNRFRS